MGIVSHAGNKPRAADVTKDAEEEGWSFFNGVAGMRHKAAQSNNICCLEFAFYLDV